MNWLMGSNPSVDNPETPAHKWVFNALKAVVMPETPFPKATTKPSGDHTHLQNSILKGSRFTREKRTHSVTFHKSVRTPPKRAPRSTLPREFSGRFPSPYTPKVVAIDDVAHESDARDYEESPIAPEKDRRETVLATTNNPLKKLSLQLNEPKYEQSTIQMKSRPRPQETSSAILRHQHEKPLKWNVDQGFEEVLQSIHRNNNYLQSLITEMQESCGQIDESFFEDRSVSGSDVTVNLDEPRSRSGQYWKAKFSDFSALTTKVKVEQDNMQRALIQLKSNIQTRNHKLADDWKDKHDVLLEELEKAKKTNRNSAQIREVRELRKQVRDSETIQKERDDLREQLKIADLQIQDLRQQQSSVNTLTVTHVASEKPRPALTSTTRDPHEFVSTIANHRHQTSRHRLETTPLPNKTSHTAYEVESGAPTTTSQAPQSATARRLAKAQASLVATSAGSKSLASSNRELTLGHSEDVQIKSISDTSRLYSTQTRYAEIHQDSVPSSTLTFNKSQARTITSSSSPPIANAHSKISEVRESPRPAFASLNVNAQPVPSMALSTEEAAKKLARTEAARERLAQRRLKKEREKSQAVLVR